LQALEKENPAEVLESKLLSSGIVLLTLEQLSAEIAAPRDAIKTLLDELAGQDKVLLVKKAGQAVAVHRNNFESIRDLILTTLADFHKENPAKLGLGKAELRKVLKIQVDSELLDFTLRHLQKSDEIHESSGLISLASHKIEYSPEQEKLRKQLAELLFNEKFSTSSESGLAEKLKADQKVVREVLSLMIGLGEVIRTEGNIYFHPHRVKEAETKVAAHFDGNKEITVGQFKDLLEGASRKYALPLLLYFDSLGITERNGDVRILGDR